MVGAGDPQSFKSGYAFRVADTFNVADTSAGYLHVCAGWRSRFSGTSVVGLSIDPLSNTGTRLLQVGSSLVLETSLTRVPGDVKWQITLGLLH